MILKCLPGSHILRGASGRHTCVLSGGLRNSAHFPGAQNLTTAEADRTLRPRRPALSGEGESGQFLPPPYTITMIPRTIAQAVVGDTGVIARSDDFEDTWAQDVERVVTGFALPPGVSAPDCLFTTMLVRRRVAVVSVSGRRFRFLVLPRPLYDVIPDPFAIADRYPPRWDASGTLPTLEWPEEPLPRRTVHFLDGVFKHGDGPLLLGACQTLVDTGRIALVRSQPDAKVCRDLWALLPDSTRRQTWLATFAYSTDLGFHLVVLPALPEGGIVGY